LSRGKPNIGGRKVSEPIKLHKGLVVNGKFVADDSLAYSLAYARLEGKRVCVSVKRESKKRSSNQNAYYHGVIIQLIGEWTGYTAEETHEMLKWMFLRKQRDGLPDTVRSTTSLTTVEMEEYHEHIRQWACLQWKDSDKGGYIPLPNEVEL
jgi:hypothetical protein